MSALQILPGTGRGTARSVVEGTGAVEGNVETLRRAAAGPSVASRHLPVPGRI